MRFSFFIYLIIQLNFFIYFINSYRKIDNLSNLFRRNNLNPLKSISPDYNKIVDIENIFLKDDNLYPNFSSLFKTLNNYVLPGYNDLKQSYPISILAVSGGVDSMSLLHSFYHIFSNVDILSHIYSTTKYDLKNSLEKMYNNTFVVHFNHKCRKESKNDWDFVKNTCKNLKFPFIGIEADHDYIDDNDDIKIKSQRQCRIWRNNNYSKIISNLFNKNSNLDAEIIYPEERIAFNKDQNIEFYSNRVVYLIGRALRTYSNHTYNPNTIGYIFTGHTLNDSVETVIFKLFRGVNIKNIRGIGEFSPLDVNNNISIVRPFVFDYKKSLIDFMKSKKYSWREDRSNGRLCYRRNVIRNLLVPILYNLTGHNNASEFSGKTIGEFSNQNNPFLPQCITDRMMNLANQSKFVDEMIESECMKFKNYIRDRNMFSGDYENTDLSITDSRQRSYNSLMTYLSNKQFKNKNSTIHKRIDKLRKHIWLFGIKMPSFFSIYEWSLVEHYLVKITILKNWIDANIPGIFISFNALSRLYKFIIDENKRNLTNFIINNDFRISKHGMFMRMVRRNHQEYNPNLDPEEGFKVYSDNYVNFYTHDFLDIKVDSPVTDKFGVNLILPISENNIQNFDIRLARTNDIMLFQQLERRTVYGILGKMEVPSIVKDCIPVIAIHKTNKVIGIYGFKIIPPYQPKSDIYIDCNFLKTESNIDSCQNQLKTYRINITN